MKFADITSKPLLTTRKWKKAATGKQAQTANFHRQCIEMGRRFHLTCQHSMRSQIFHREKKLTALLEVAEVEVANHQQTIALIRHLRIVPYDMPKHKLALQRMQDFLKKN